MSLTCVKMSEDVWLTCLTHSLTTEKEEIMGLLFGDIQVSSNGNATALIWGASPQTRSDRCKDRVETNPEQLAAASSQAEKMTISTGRTTRVIGWYHSHPHITVLPSHVDVKTQAMYQILDSGFVGLIFSCFSEDSRKVGRIQVIAFQSQGRKQKEMLRSVPLFTGKSNSFVEVESSLSSSENVLQTSEIVPSGSNEQDSTDSRAIKGVSKASNIDYFGQEKMEGIASQDLMSIHTTNDDDSMDMTAIVQEAMHRSNLDMSGAEYVRKEVPLQIFPTQSLLKLNSPLTSFTKMQYVLSEEEQAAYKQAILQNMRGGKVHPLGVIHHTSTYRASMCTLMEYCLVPAINVLQDRLKENEIRLAILAEEAKALEMSTTKDNEIESRHYLPSERFSGFSPVFSPRQDALAGVSGRASIGIGNLLKTPPKFV